MYFYLIN